jgi:hypothetical protein
VFRPFRNGDFLFKNCLLRLIIGMLTRLTKALMPNRISIPTTVVWPSPSQELLLQTALSSDELSLQAWRDWRSGADPQHLDVGSSRLLPLIFRRLHEPCVNDPWQPRLKQAYRQTLGRNSLLFHHAAHICDEFARLGISTLLLKGVPLSQIYYADTGARPMSDVDILVTPAEAPRAFAWLRENGWQPQRGGGEGLIPFTNGLSWKNSAGLEFDLHWNLMFGCWRAYDDAPFWAAAQPFKLSGREYHTLGATDMLLHVLFHGARWNVTPPLRWIPDAVMILKNARDDIDWLRLLELARERRLSLMLRETLGYLHRTFAAPVPPFVLATLSVTPVSHWEQLAYEDKMRAQADLTLGGWLRYWRYAYTHVTKRTDERPSPLVFAQALRELWGVPHLWQLPLRAFSFTLWRTTKATIRNQ